MKFFRKLEFRFGAAAPRGIMTYLTAMYAAGFVISIMRPEIYFTYLSLNAEKILSGQVWRLVSWLMYPPSTGLIFGVIMLYVYFSLGNMLERLWGSFKFDVFIFSGILFHILAAFVLYAIFGRMGSAYMLTPANLNLSILLAFIMSIPDAQFLLFFVIPVKASWIGIFYIAMILLQFVTGSAAEKIEIALSLLNFFIFYFVSGKADRFRK